MPFTPSERLSFITFAKQNKIAFNTGWQNFSESQKQPEAIVFNISDVQEIQKILAKIQVINQEKKPYEKLTLRVAAGGQNTSYSESFSFTPGVPADIILQLTHKKFKNVAVLDEKKHIVKVGASIQIGELDKILYDKFQLTLPTSSLIPYVTFGGLTANAGHGTGKSQPSVAGLMRAMTFLKPDGSIERIDHTHPDFENIRGSHLGVFGILLEAEIECIPAQKLECTIKTTDLKGLIGEIQKGLLHQYPYVTMMYLPNYTQDSLQNIAISHWTPVSLKTKSTRMNATARHLSQERAIRYSKKFHIEEILTTYPNVIPFYMNYIVSKFGLEKESVTVRPWYDIAHSQTSFPKNLDDAGYLFSTDKDGKEVIQALNQVTDALNLYAKNKKYPLTYAIYVRFFQGTRGGLSTSQHADQQYVCAFDMVSHPTIPGYLEFKKDMQHFFMNELHAKPHWGKHIPLEVDYAKMYGENFVSFKKSLSDWYKDCKMDIQKSPFLNTFHSTILQIPEKVKPIFERDKKPPLSHEKLHPQHVKKFAGQLFNEVRKDKTNPAAEEFLQVLKKIR